MLALALLNFVMGQLMRAGGVRLIVNTLYVSRLGIVREWLIRGLLSCCSRCREHELHSTSLRVDVPLAPLPPLPKPSSAAATDAEQERFCSVHSIAMMADNYAYLLVDRSSGSKPYPAALIDPADPVVAAREMHRIEVRHYGGDPANVGQGLQLVALLITHKHWDHAGGNSALLKQWALKPDKLNDNKPSVALRVYGGIHDGVWKCTHPLAEGMYAAVGSLRLKAIHTPCHTCGSIMYQLKGAPVSNRTRATGRLAMTALQANGRVTQDVLFTGDSLFIGGNGAQFEGTSSDMNNNMRKLWLHCSPEALIFPGHEYTVPILRERFSEHESGGGLPVTEAGLWRRGCGGAKGVAMRARLTMTRRPVS